MSEQTASDASESAPGVERTSVLALDELETHDVRRALVLLAGLRSRTLAPLVRSAAVPGGVALTHRVPGDAVGLASLRADGPLRAGHVLAVGVAVLEALVTLHAARLAHGRVDGESVLVAPDGSVVLAATGSAWAAAPGEPGGPSPADDVAAVGELLRDLLGPGSAPAPLVVAVVRAVDPDLALRPDAASLLDALHRCGRPEPLLDALWSPRDAAPGEVAVQRPQQAPAAGAAMPDDAVEKPARAAATTRPSSLRPPREAARPARRRRRSRSSGQPASRRASSAWRLFAVTVVAVGVGAGALAVSGRGDVVAAPTTAAAATQPAPSSAAPAAPAPTPTLPATSAATAWGSVLAEIDRGRTAALAAGSPQQLRAWVTGTAYAADLALARTVAAAGARIDGGGLVLEEVRPVDVDATTAVLAVRDRRAAYAVVAEGSRQEVPERAARTWTVTLVRGGSPTRWRIAEVADATLSPGGRR